MKKTSTYAYAPLKDTDLCVMCGMCLPHCPTYFIYQTETESPRGRLSLIQAVAQGRLDYDASVQLHLEHCLGCMACEAMCPSKVPYGQLLDDAKNILQPRQPAPYLKRQLLKSTLKPDGLAAWFRTLTWLKLIRIDKVITAGLKFAGQAHAGELLGQQNEHAFQSHYPARTNSGKKVVLFSGCMGTSYDSETLENSIKVLNHLGYDVELPEKQFCCGALHQHNGQIEQARQLEEENRQVFSQLDVRQLIFVSNGCGDQLTKALTDFKVNDIVSFLLSRPELKDLSYQTSPLKVLLHESCSSLNKLHIGGISRKILETLPGIQISEFETAKLCCGAGGTHQLTQPDLTRRLLAIKLDEIKKHSPSYLVTDNLGCGLNFRTGLKHEGINLEVIHPVTLLARRMKC